MRISFLNVILILILMIMCSACADQIVEPTSTTTDDSTPPVQVTSTKSPQGMGTTLPNPILKWNELSCSVIIEAEWGSGAGEYGCSRPWCPGTIKVTEGGTIFIDDPENDRIFKYLEGSQAPEEISLPDEYSNIGFFPYSLDENHIYINLINDDVLILSLEGKDSTLLDLSIYEPYSPTFIISADGSGGFYLTLMQIVEDVDRHYIMLHYINENDSQIIDIGSELSDLLRWRLGEELRWNMIVGRDKNIYSHDDYTSNIHDWGSSRDAQFKEWNSTIEIHFPENSPFIDQYFARLVSVDAEGLFYAIIKDSYGPQDRQLVGLIKFDGQGEINATGLFSEYWKAELQSVPYPEIAPDGSLYALAYEQDDLSIPLRVVRCTFNDSEY
jgi:hypothetical protein